MDKELRVEITAETKKLNQGIRESEQQISGFSGTVKKAGAALMGAFAAGAVLTGLKNMVIELTNTADRLLDLKEITGLTTTQLQEYEHVARVAGVGMGTITSAVEGLTQRMARATGEGGALNMALRQLEISARNSAGNLRNGGEIMEEVIGKLSSMENVTERNVLGARIFAGAWKELAPILALGGEGIAAAREEAHKLGIILSGDALEAADDFRVEMEKLNAQWVAAKREVTMAALPALSAAADQISALALIIRTEAVPWYEKLLALMRGRPDALFVEHVRFEGLTEAEQQIEKIGRQLEKERNELEKLRRPLGQLFQERGALETQIKKVDELQNQYNALFEQKLSGQDELRAAEIAAAEAAAAATAAAEKERLAALGMIGRLAEEISTAEKNMIAANTMAEARRWGARKKALEEEKKLIEEIAIGEITRAELAARDPALAQRFGIAFPTPMPAMPTLPASPIPENDPYLAQMAARTAATQEFIEKMKTMGEAATPVSESFQAMANELGLSLAHMAMAGNVSAGAMIKQAIAIAVAHLIKSIMMSFPFPVNVAMAIGAGAFAGKIMAAIPAYAQGGIVPPGFPNDTYLARLTSGEKIIPAGESPQGLGGLQLTARVSGQDLLFLLRETERRNLSNF